MSVDHAALQLALRAQLLTLAAVTTGSTTLEATATGYQRASGSFLTDGFAAGMEVTPSGFTETTRGVITVVTALTMTISGGRTVEASASGRTLTVGVPQRCGWNNQPVEPVAGAPYLEEEYLPATAELRTFPATGGSMTATGLYVLRWYSRAAVGILALRVPADAVLALFAPGTTFSLASGAVARVRTDVAPVAGAIQSDGDGWAVVTITIPWRVDYINQ